MPFILKKPIFSIKELAKKAIDDIKTRQGLFTHPSRKEAVQNIQAVLDNQKATDDEIKQSFEQACKLIRDNQAFGCRGERGSYFIQRSNQFLQEAGRKTLFKYSLDSRVHGTIC